MKGPMNTEEINKRFDFAMSQVFAHRPVIQDAFYRDFEIEKKRDNSFVTEVDKSIEKSYRRAITRYFPHDGIIGEEFGTTNGTSGFTWSLDPIDGTSSFVHRVPLFGTLLGLMVDSEVVMGIMDFPLLKENIYALKDQGCFWSHPHGQGPKKVFIQNEKPLEECTFSYSASEYFERSNRSEVLKGLKERCGLERVWGDCYGHLLVATGRIDLMVDPLLHPWDYIPLEIIMCEAGLDFRDLDGKSGLEINSGASASSYILDQL